MEFLLLGPLEVRRDGQPLLLGPRRAQRCLLGLLLLETGRMVPVDRLADLLWDDDPPDNARAILQTHVSRLRAALDPHRDGRDGVRLIGQTTGYELQADPTTVDTFRFRTSVSNAERLTEPAARAAALRDALSLWRGPVMADVASDRLRDRVGTGLAELRLHAWEACIEAELECGRHHEVIAELTDLVAANPLRERLVQALMVALHRDGRQADALAAFHDARERIAELTGLDLGPELIRVRDEILRGGSTADTVDAPNLAGPQQLPADIAHFVGRHAELTQIIRLGSATHAFAMIALIYGTGGSGKSALAIRAARRLSDQFPDGQLYLDLQGSTPGMPPLPPHTALERMLRALGIDGHDIPRDQADRAALFREVSAQRRLLILLDNAKDAAQVKPLLTSNPRCFVIVTSRTLLSTLDNATALKVHTLARDEALDLLAHFDKRALGTEHMHLADTIVRHCGYLPLAVRIAGARLAARPDRALEQVERRLSAQRLDELEQDDLSVRATIAISHDGLTSEPSDRLAARLFERIGVLNCHHLTAPVAAALAGSEEAPASSALRRLAEHQLVQPLDADRYGLHDLVRLYAAELGRALPPQIQAATITGALEHYAAMATRAAHTLFPGLKDLPPIRPDPRIRLNFAHTGSAREWIEAELANILVVAKRGVEHAPTAVIELTRALRFPLYDMLCRWSELGELGEYTLAAARRTRASTGLAIGHETIALALIPRGDLDTAISHATQALSLYREASDWYGECGALFVHQAVHRERSNYAEAAACLNESIAIARAHAAPRVEANHLDNLGTVYSRMSRHDEAIVCHMRGLRIRRAHAHRLGIAASNENLGWTLLHAGSPAQAVPRFREAAQLGEEVGYSTLQAASLWGLGCAKAALGQSRAAREAWRQSIDVLLGLGAITPDEAAHALSQTNPNMPKALRRLHN